MTAPQRIIRLEVEDFLRIRAAAIAPDGKAVVIGGLNGEGKSSLLIAIEALFGGKKHTPIEPVRKGAKESYLLCETTDYIVEKHIRKNGNAEVELRAKDGAIIPRPHELLSKLWDDLTFDPCAFDRKDPKEQAEILRNLVGLDTSKDDAEHEAKYGERTEVGRELKRIAGALDSMPEIPPGTPDVEVSSAELVAEAERRQKVNAENDGKRRQLEWLRANGRVLVEESRKADAAVEKAREALAAAEQRAAQMVAELDGARAKAAALDAEVKALKDEDLDAVKAQLASAEKTNAAVRAKHARAKLEEEHEAKLKESERLTGELAAIEKRKADAVAAAKFPIQGLEVTDEGVRLNGVPFAQASQAERLRASAAIGAAQKKGLRCMLIREGAFLDAKSMALLLGPIAQEFDLQPIVEVVGDRSECTVIMEDGQVVEDRTEKTARGDGRQPATGVA